MRWSSTIPESIGRARQLGPAVVVAVILVLAAGGCASAGATAEPPSPLPAGVSTSVRPDAVPIAMGNSAVIPRPFQERRHEGFLQIIQDQDEIDCLLMGDSITDWWARFAPELYAEHFGSRNCVNFGIAGDRTEGVLWRMENGELDGYSPRLMMLMIGTNNLTPIMGRDVNTPAQIAEGVGAVIAKFRSTFPEARVLLLGVFPRGAEPDNRFREPIREINELIARFADGDAVRYMDIGPAFLAPDGSLPEEIMPDALHPNLRGYEIWAEQVMPTFIEMLGGVHSP